MLNKENESITHESFGQISFSRITGRQNFYGSELSQDHYIQMTVYRSRVTVTLPLLINTLISATPPSSSFFILVFLHLIYDSLIVSSFFP